MTSNSSWWAHEFFSSAGEKSDSSGSSGSESPNRGQNNSDNGPQTWLGTLNGFDSENGRCPESSFHHPGPQLYTGAPGHSNFHEIQQETQFYYRTGSIINTFLAKNHFSTSKKEFLENGWLTYWGQQPDEHDEQTNKQDQI